MLLCSSKINCTSSQTTLLRLLRRSERCVSSRTPAGGGQRRGTPQKRSQGFPRPPPPDSGTRFPTTIAKLRATVYSSVDAETFPCDTYRTSAALQPRGAATLVHHRPSAQIFRQLPHYNDTDMLLSTFVPSVNTHPAIGAFDCRLLYNIFKILGSFFTITVIRF